MVAVNLDQKQPGFLEHVLPAYLTDLANFDVIEQDTYSVVQALTPEGKTTCGLLPPETRYSLQPQRKLAQQKSPRPHLDDVVETLMLNMFTVPS